MERKAERTWTSPFSITANSTSEISPPTPERPRRDCNDSACIVDSKGPIKLANCLNNYQTERFKHSSDELNGLKNISKPLRNTSLKHMQAEFPIQISRKSLQQSESTSINSLDKGHCKGTRRNDEPRQ